MLWQEAIRRELKKSPTYVNGLKGQYGSQFNPSLNIYCMERGISASLGLKRDYIDDPSGALLSWVFTFLGKVIAVSILPTCIW